MREWPRRYTTAELDAIAESIGHSKLQPFALDKLQEAVEAYQWARAADEDNWIEHGIKRRSATKRRRKQLKNIISLCDQREVKEVEVALNELDGWTSQLLGAVNQINLQDVKSAAERALPRIAKSGPDRQRARRQFIKELRCIFRLVTGDRPGRRVRVQEYHSAVPERDEREYGPFHDFVTAALKPFGAKATKGREADIKQVLGS